MAQTTLSSAAGSSRVPRWRSRVRRAQHRGKPWLPPLLVGVLAFALSFAGSWIPSLWGDEAASILSAERPWASLWRMLGSVDAVHGAYYALLHIWVDVFGSSAVSVRLPSALAVALAAAGVVVLAQRLAGRRLAVIAGLVFAALPRTTFMGAEARSYALSAACAVWLTVLFTQLVSGRSRSWLPWLGFALATAASVYVFLYTVLLVAVYGAVLVLQRAPRALVARWALASAAGVVLSLPVIVAAISQRGQVGFLQRDDALSWSAVFVSQWFVAPILAGLGWVGIAAGIVLVLVRRRRKAGRTASPSVLELALCWSLIPTVLLVAGNALVPVYLARYLSFTTPAVALVLACAIEAAAGPRVWMAAIGVAAVVLLALPTYVGQRTLYAKDNGSDWAEVSQTVGAHAHRGDAIVFDEDAPASRDPRLAMRTYPAGFAGLQDVTLREPWYDTDGLWDSTESVGQATARLRRGDGRVWLIAYRGTDATGTVTATGEHSQLAALQRQGYHVESSYALHRDSVLLLQR